MQYTTSKIDGIKMHFEDLESYFNKNQSDLEKDKQFYWNKKIEQLKLKVSTLPNQLQKALKNNQKIMQNQGQPKLRGGMERRKIKQLSDENDKLSRAQEIA